MNEKHMTPEQIAGIEATIESIDNALSTCQRQMNQLQEEMAKLRAERRELVRKLPDEQRIDHLF